MAGFVPSPVTDRSSLRLQVEEAVASAAARDQLEHLMGDVAAEILLLEVDLRRVERALLTAAGPQIQPRDLQAQVELRDRLVDDLDGLRVLAAGLRARLKTAP